MDCHVNETTQELSLDPAMVEKAFDNPDPDIRKLPLNSPELNAALLESEKDADHGDDDASAGDDDHENGTEHDKKKPRGRDRRIDQLTAKIGELQRSLEERQQPPQQTEPVYQHPVEKPKFADFKTFEDYSEALTEWKLEARDQQQAQARRYQELQKQSEVVRTTWESKEKEFVQEASDYSDVVTVKSLTAARPSNEARLYLGECEDGPRVIYTILSDPELAEKFASANPVKQVAMLAQLDMQVSAGSNVKKTIATKAPTPPRNLPSGKTSSVARSILENAHELSFEEWDRQVSQVMRSKKR
jgi:hypothetical protein